MSKIELSPQLGIDCATRIVGYPGHVDIHPTNVVHSWCPLLNNNPGVAGWTGEILIMKGVIPDDFSTLVDTTVRESDILVIFSAAYFDTINNPSNFGSTETGVNPCTIQTDYVKAIATGDATWFWWRVKEKGLTGLTSIPQQIIGNTGTVGLGADLEIPDIHVITDLAYRITNFKLQFPTSWIY